MAAIRRIQKELGELVKSPVEHIQVKPADDDLFHWKGSIDGPASSVYKGGLFQVDITFPTDYPFKPPVVKFQTKIYHPNVDDDGSICLHMIKSEVWKPATKLVDVLAAVVNLLVQPNPDDPLQTSIAELYKTDLPKFQKTAKDWVKKYAS